MSEGVTDIFHEREKCITRNVRILKVQMHGSCSANVNHQKINTFEIRYLNRCNEHGDLVSVKWK